MVTTLTAVCSGNASLSNSRPVSRAENLVSSRPGRVLHSRVSGVRRLHWEGPHPEITRGNSRHVCGRSTFATLQVGILGESAVRASVAPCAPLLDIISLIGILLGRVVSDARTRSRHHVLFPVVRMSCRPSFRSRPIRVPALSHRAPFRTLFHLPVLPMQAADRVDQDRFGAHGIGNRPPAVRVPHAEPGLRRSPHVDGPRAPLQVKDGSSPIRHMTKSVRLSGIPGDHCDELQAGSTPAP